LLLHRVQGSGFKVQGSGFRETADTVNIGPSILMHGRIGPAAIGLGQLFLQGSFHAVEHPDAFLVSRTILFV
jgi:hypothetical protein